MIIFLYGPDSYRRTQKQREIVAEYRKKHPGFDVAFFDSEERGALFSLKEFIKNRSLFDSFKLARVSGLEMFNVAEDVSWLASLLSVESVVLVITADSKPPKELLFLTKKPSIAQEFKILTGIELKEFIEREAKRRGARLSDAQRVELGSEYRNDMWGMITELEKRSLANAQPESLRYISPDFFTLIKSLAYGNEAQKIIAVGVLLETDDAGKAFNILAALTSGQKKIQMADYDVAIKSGKLDYEVALLDFALSR